MGEGELLQKVKIVRDSAILSSFKIHRVSEIDWSQLEQSLFTSPIVCLLYHKTIFDSSSHKLQEYKMMLDMKDFIL